MLKKKMALSCLLFVLSNSLVFAQQTSESAPAQEIDVQELEKKGFELFQTTPAEAIVVFKKVGPAYEQQGRFPKAGITYLNIANIYDEYLNELDSAIHFSNKSLTIWESLQDTLQQANLLKYLGLLHGKTGDFEQAKTQIQKAKTFYVSQNFEPGIAVSDFNMAQVYLKKGDFEQSEKFFLHSIQYWKKVDDKGRIFANNLIGIDLYYQSGKKEKAELLIRENQKILQLTAVNDYILNKFEELRTRVEE